MNRCARGVDHQELAVGVRGVERRGPEGERQKVPSRSTEPFPDEGPGIASGPRDEA